MNIYRHEIRFEEAPKSFSMPKGSKVVDAAYQTKRAAFSIYAETPSEPETEERTFAIYPTGTAVLQNAKHIRSIVMPDGFHVFHIYEITKRSEDK